MSGNNLDEILMLRRPTTATGTIASANANNHTVTINQLYATGTLVGTELVLTVSGVDRRFTVTANTQNESSTTIVLRDADTTTGEPRGRRQVH